MNEKLIGIEKLLAQEPIKIMTTISQAVPPNTSYIVYEADENGQLQKFHASLPYFRFALLPTS